LINQNISAVHQSPTCVICGGGDHLAINYNWGGSAEGDAKQVNVLNNNYRPQNNSYSNTYNPGWRNHLNFSWRNNQDNQSQNLNQSSNQNRSNQGYGQRQFDQSTPQKSNLEQMMEKMMQEQAEFRQDQKRVNQQVADQIRDLGMKVDLLTTQGKPLKTQVAQHASSSSRQHGQLPLKPDYNPNASVKAITLRSETTYDGPEMPPDVEVHVHQKQPDFQPESR
jgi:DNA-binding protein H-NS